MEGEIAEDGLRRAERMWRRMDPKIPKPFIFVSFFLVFTSF